MMPVAPAKRDATHDGDHVAMDPEAFRADSRERWERAAPGWRAAREPMQRAAEGVSRWLLEAIGPQPGQTVLELAAGPGDTGLMAAELVAPDGKVIVTDFADEMVAIARERAAELQLANVEVRQMEAEWIDLPAASVDGVLCRWGYMLVADPEAALRETRRVLRPGRRIALAAWDAPAHNPWLAVIGREGVRAGVFPPPDPAEPGPFALAEPGRVEDLLLTAGFDEVVLDTVDVTFEADSLDAWWEQMSTTSGRMMDALKRLTPAEHYALRDAVDAAYAPWVGDDGRLRVPGRTLVAAATA
jgi:SAM-dependent methyltransferase